MSRPRRNEPWEERGDGRIPARGLSLGGSGAGVGLVPSPGPDRVPTPALAPNPVPDNAGRLVVIERLSNSRRWAGQYWVPAHTVPTPEAAEAWIAEREWDTLPARYRWVWR
jgi:hypothetical protein